MMLVHYVVDKETNTTVLTELIGVWRKVGAEPTLTLRETATATGIVHEGVTKDLVFPAYPVKDIN